MTMGRGRSWTAREKQHIAEAWIHVSTSPIVGAYQKGAVFRAAVHREFVRRDPNPSAPGGGYAVRTPAAALDHFSTISADVQKFAKALRAVRACDPTGVSEGSIVSMAVAVHLGKTRQMADYDHVDELHTSWPNYCAWVVMRCQPKWDGAKVAGPRTRCPSGGSTNAPDDRLASPASYDDDGGPGAATSGQVTTGEHTLSGRAAVVEGGLEDPTREEALVTAARAVERPPGRKAARSAKLQMRELVAAEDLANSQRRANELRQARLDIMCFEGSDMDDEDEQDKREFFKLMRRKALRRAREESAGTDGGAPAPKKVGLEEQVDEEAPGLLTGLTPAAAVVVEAEGGSDK